MTTIGVVKPENQSFFSYHSNNQFRQESSVGAKTTDWKFVGEHDVYLLPYYLIIKKVSKTTLLVELSGRETLIKWSNLVSPNSGITWHHVPPDGKHWEVYNIADMVFLPKMY